MTKEQTIRLLQWLQNVAWLVEWNAEESPHISESLDLLSEHKLLIEMLTKEAE